MTDWHKNVIMDTRKTYTHTRVYTHIHMHTRTYVTPFPHHFLINVLNALRS